MTSINVMLNAAGPLLNSMNQILRQNYLEKTTIPMLVLNLNAIFLHSMIADFNILLIGTTTRDLNA